MFTLFDLIPCNYEHDTSPAHSSTPFIRWRYNQQQVGQHSDQREVYDASAVVPVDDNAAKSDGEHVVDVLRQRQPFHGQSYHHSAQ